MAVLTEFSLRLPNSPGALADVCRLMADERVTILALGLDTTGPLRLVVNNPTRAAGAFREMHYTFTIREALAVTVAHGPGGHAAVLRLLADADVNVEYAYAGGGDGRAGMLVLGVDDPVRAATIAGV